MSTLALWGAADTYQAMDHRDEAFWRLLDEYRVFVVFDEIHHCAGNGQQLSNAWGSRFCCEYRIALLSP